MPGLRRLRRQVQLHVGPAGDQLGRKRRINQSACNKDFSCVQGSARASSAVHGGRLRRKARQSAGEGAALPYRRCRRSKASTSSSPASVAPASSWARCSRRLRHLDGLRAGVLDLTGMAQSTAMSHLRFMPAGCRRASLRARPTPIGCDLIVSAGGRRSRRWRRPHFRGSELGRDSHRRIHPHARLGPRRGQPARIRRAPAASSTPSTPSGSRRRWTTRSRPTCSCSASPGSTTAGDAGIAREAIESSRSISRSTARASTGAGAWRSTPTRY